MATKTQKTDLQNALALCRKSFFTAGFFSLFINALMLVPALYMLQLYDRVITSGSQSTLIMLTLIVVVLFITMGLLEWARSRILIKVGSRIDVLLNGRLFDATFKNSLVTGSGSSQPMDDLRGLRQFLSGNGLFAFFDSPWVPIYVAVMYMFHPWYGYVAVITVIILLCLALINEKLTSKPLQDANAISIDQREKLNKNLRNAEVVQSMGMLDGMRQRWNQSGDKILELQESASKKSGTVTSISKNIRLMSQSLILGLGAYLVLQQEVTPGLMIAGSILLGRALAPIDLMINAWKGFIAARGQYARLNELLQNIPAERERMPLPAPKGHLQVQNIIVVPPGGKVPVIHGVNFELPPGKALGIIGPSAAGKSCLARVLLGIWPVANGKVRLDGADIYDWDRIQLGPHIGYLPQDVELFDGTISENIARFGDVDPEAVVVAAQKADVHEMILTLPAGYDTKISANGGVLSGGQRQRIGLARAIYGHPKLVLLDEPNANLDEKGEAALAGAIEKVKAQGTTLIIISHKKGILGQLDNLLLLRDGYQAAFGSKEDVMRHIQQSTTHQAIKKNSDNQS